MKSRQATNIAEAVTRQSTDKRIKFSFEQRVMLGALLAQQNQSRITKYIGRDATEDDQVCIYSLLRKIRAEREEMAPYVRKFGGEQQLNMEAVHAVNEVSQRVLDGFEVKLLKSLLAGWLKTDAVIGDRDWATPVLEQLA